MTFLQITALALPCRAQPCATFEAGKSDMRASTIAKLCEALGVTVTYKIDGTEISGP